MNPILCEKTLQQLAEDIGSDILPELFAVFIEENEPKLERLPQLNVRQDLAELQSLFHTLKSSAASYGGLRLAAFATDLDFACKNEDYLKIEQMLPEFTQIYVQTLQVMRQRY
ncbi:Hpt domain-containing protein [Celerinatantimonas sp. YJH-8]|uniref:Hpt domain-containing protein n=1 Tax=Celerinatantimonas sp. YJH-8 TaxID=3228714 RepID=UPI0038C3D14E